MARIKSHVPTDASELIDFLDAIDSESKRAKESWPSIGKWDDDIRGYRGDLDKQGQAPTIFGVDLISPALRRKYALLTESEPTFDVSPNRAGLDNTAKMFKTIIKAGWSKWALPMALEQSGMHLGVMGSTFWRVSWDRKALYGLGDIRTPAIDPRHVRVDPRITKAYELEHADYIIIESLRGFGEIAAYEPKAADLIEPSARVNLIGKGKQGFWAGLRGRLKSPATGDFSQRIGGGSSENAIPRAYVREYLVRDPATERDGTALYPGGRYFIRVGDPDEEGVVINYLPDRKVDRTQNPYFDGQWDLEWLDNVPDPDHPWGRSEVQALRKLADAFNRTGNLLIKNWLRNGFPWVIAQSGALTPTTIQELKDLEQNVLTFIQRGGNEVRREPSVVGEATAMETMRLIMLLVDYTIGLADPSMEGKGRVEMRSGQQLEGLQQAAQILVRAEARRLEQFLERIGQKLISRVLQFYPEERIMTYYAGDNFSQYKVERSKLVAEIQQLGIQTALKEAKGNPPDINKVSDAILSAIKGAWRDMSFSIVPYSSLSTTKVQRAMLKRQLAQEMLIPGSDVLDELGYSNSLEKTAAAVAWNHARQLEGVPPPQPPKQSSSKKK